MKWFINLFTIEHTEFSWYRKLRGGYWIYYLTSGWHKVSESLYQAEYKNRMGKPSWSLEDNTQK